MENVHCDERCSGHPNAAAKFLEAVRSGFPNAEMLRTFDNCLVEYQAALIALLISEELRGKPEADGEPDDRGAGETANNTSARLTHVQQVIARAQTYEQHQQALAAYLEARQRLKKTLKHLQGIPPAI